MPVTVNGPAIGQSGAVSGGGNRVSTAKLPSDWDKSTLIQIDRSPDAAVRASAIVWHPVKGAWYCIADVVLTSNPNYPDTIASEIGLWKSTDFKTWTYLGICVQKAGDGSDAGVASPSGAVYWGGKLVVPYAIRGSTYSMGVATSATDPDTVPWTRSNVFTNAAQSGIDDPCFVLDSFDGSLNLYFNRTVPSADDGVPRQTILQCRTTDPVAVGAYTTPAVCIPRRPNVVTTQELASAFAYRGAFHLLVMEQNSGTQTGVVHYVAPSPSGPFVIPDAGNPFITTAEQMGLTPLLQGLLTYGIRAGEIVGAVQVVTIGSVYGLQGYLTAPGYFNALSVGADATSQTISNNTWTKVVLSDAAAQAFKSTVSWLSATNRGVCVDPGYYEFSGGVSLTGNLNAGNLVQLQVRVNVSDKYIQLDARKVPTTAFQVFNLSGLGKPVYLAAGDYFELFAWHEAPGTLSKGTDPTVTWMAAKRL